MTEQERRQRERRSATLTLPYAEGQRFIRDQHYTGPYTVHAAQGVNQQITIPNPDGYRQTVDKPIRDAHIEGAM